MERKPLPSEIGAMHPSPENTQLMTDMERLFHEQPELLDKFDADFVSELASYWRETVRDEFDEPLTPEQEAAVLDEALVREMSFFAKVYNAATYMADHFPGTVTMLFDVDNTLREPGAERTRPAFKLVIDSLSERLGERVEVGLLTTIPRSALVSESGSPVYLEGVGSKLNPEFIICSGEYPQPGVDADGWSNKTAIVEDLAVRYQNRSFVFVDDLKSDERETEAETRIRCVTVTAEVHNDFWRNTASGA